MLAMLSIKSHYYSRHHHIMPPPIKPPQSSARGPGEARIREAARSMLRELEARYDNKMFDK